jgi:hypothetical protein
MLEQVDLWFDLVKFATTETTSKTANTANSTSSTNTTNNNTANTIDASSTSPNSPLTHGLDSVKLLTVASALADNGRMQRYLLAVLNLMAFILSAGEPGTREMIVLFFLFVRLVIVFIRRDSYV